MISKSTIESLSEALGYSGPPASASGRKASPNSKDAVDILFICPIDIIGPEAVIGSGGGEPAKGLVVRRKRGAHIHSGAIDQRTNIHRRSPFVRAELFGGPDVRIAVPARSR